MTNPWDAGIKAEFARLRAEALTRPCPYCHLPVGERCRTPTTGAEIVHQPAHHQRLKEV